MTVASQSLTSSELDVSINQREKICTNVLLKSMYSMQFFMSSKTIVNDFPNSTPMVRFLCEVLFDRDIDIFAAFL